MLEKTLESPLDSKEIKPVNTLSTPVFLDLLCDSAGKKSACNVGDLGSIPGLGRSPGKAKGYPLQYSGLENSMDCIVYGVAKSQTQLSDSLLHSLNIHFPSVSAATKSLQLCLTLCNPIDSSLQGFPVPGW